MAWVLASWLVTAALAQETRPSAAEQALRKAVLIEDSERDLPGAVKAYRALIDDATTPAALRTQALLRLGLVLQRLGRMEEAKTVLTQAGSGEGDAAQEAKDVLAGKRPAAEEKAAANVASRVTILISALRWAKTDQEMEEPGKELLWIGKPAVPHLSDAITGSSSADFRMVAILSAKVATIGGPDAVKLFASMAQARDPLYRRACLRMLPAVSIPAEVHEALFAFLADADPAVRLDALTAVVPHLVDVLRLCRDTDPATRALARSRLGYWLARGKPTEAELAQMIEVVRTGIDDPDAAVQHASWLLLREDSISSRRSTLGAAHPSAALNRFCLSLAARPELDRYQMLNLDFTAPPDAALLVAADEQVQQVTGARETQRWAWLSRQVSAIARNSTATWRREDLPHVVKLIERGHGDASSWLLAHAQAKDAATVARLIGRLERTRDALTWLSKQGVRTPEVCALVLAWLEERLPRFDLTDATAGRHSAQVEDAALFLAPAGDAALDQRLVGLAEARPAALPCIAQAYLTVPGPTANAALARLLVAGPKELGPEHRSYGSNMRSLRGRIVARLIRESVPDFADACAKAYSFGHARHALGDLTVDDWNRLDEPGFHDRLGGLWWLVLVDTTRGGATCHRYTPEAVAAILERCLTTGGIAAWIDLANILLRRRDSRHPSWKSRFAVAVPPEVEKVACRLALDAPVEQGLRGQILQLLLAPVTPPIQGAEALLTRALAADPQTQAVARSARSGAFVPSHLPILAPLLGSPDTALVSNAATEIVALRTPEAAAALVPLLQSQRPELRVIGVASVANAAPGRRWELLAPLLVDPERGVRAAAGDVLKEVEEVPASAWPHVKAALASQDPESVEVAIRGAFRTGSTEASAALVPLLRHAERAVRQAAAGALARHQPAAAVEQLGALLRERLPTVQRADTCDALGLTLDPKAAVLLVGELRHQEENVRGAARHALEAIAFYRDQQERWK